MGIFNPWFLIFLIYYLSGNQDLLLKNFSPEKIKPVLLIQFHFDKTIYVAAISSGALLLFSLFKLRANFYKNVIRMRNFQWVFLFCLVISVGVAFISNEKILFPFSLLAVPLSVFISYYFLTLKKTWYFESLFILWAVSIIYCYVSHS
jgi:hypothetical protein